MNRTICNGFLVANSCMNSQHPQRIESLV